MLAPFHYSPFSLSVFPPCAAVVTAQQKICTLNGDWSCGSLLPGNCVWLSEIRDLFYPPSHHNVQFIWNVSVLILRIQAESSLSGMFVFPSDSSKAVSGLKLHKAKRFKCWHKPSESMKRVKKKEEAPHSRWSAMLVCFILFFCWSPTGNAGKRKQWQLQAIYSQDDFTATTFV